MKRVLLVAAALALPIATVSAQSDCSRPQKPELPDGASATQDDMVAAQGEVKTYLTAADKYRVCLKKESEAIGDPEDEEQEARQKRLIKHFNSMVDEMHAVGKDFNKEIKAFQAGAE